MSCHNRWFRLLRILYYLPLEAGIYPNESIDSSNRYVRTTKYRKRKHYEYASDLCSWIKIGLLDRQLPPSLLRWESRVLERLGFDEYIQCQRSVRLE